MKYLNKLLASCFIATFPLTTFAPALWAQKPANASVREFRVDAGHSDVSFSIGFLGHPVRGRFSDIKGALAIARDRPELSAVTAVIGVKSINTGSANRDEHLRSSDFFDAEKFPLIMFHSSQIDRRGKSLLATGALTMHGVTRDVSIQFAETSPPIEDPHGSTLVVYSGSVRLARKDFGILGGSKYNDWFDNLRSATMADSVDITLDIEGWDTDFSRVKTYDQALAKIERDGVAETVANIRALKAQHPDTLRGAEWEFDQVARAVLSRGQTNNAISLFRLNTELFPRSSAAHSALARAYEVDGNTADARASVMRALAIDSLDVRAIELRRRVGNRF